jgi:MoaA/NifB/PqqE/SkfB family radical SAM enzyme
MFNTESAAAAVAIPEKQETDYSSLLNSSLKVFFTEAVRISVRNPVQACYFLKIVEWQRKAARVRASWKQRGVQVPPILIYSITSQCNLHCQGCYHHALRSLGDPELNDAEMRKVISEARELGISFMVLAGGEPLTRAGVIPITGDFPDVIFLVFTNGMLIDNAMIGRFKAQRNVVPILSLEGFERETDDRRGKGIYRHLQETIKKLNSHRIFFGTSLTVTRANYATVTDERFVRHLAGEGCKLFFFSEYTAIDPLTQEWEISGAQRAGLAGLMKSFRARYKALFVSVPGDEDQFGGCLSAGRGFIHVSSEGNVEPCPFVPYSDSNLRDLSLRQALQSALLKRIRENNVLETGGHGGCVLWEKREWVQMLVAPGLSIDGKGTDHREG